MDALESLAVRVRRVRSLLAGDNSGDGPSDREDDISQAYRLLRLVKLLLVIILTALTIAQMLGWL